MRGPDFTSLLELAERGAARPCAHSGKARPGDIFVLLPPAGPGAGSGLEYAAAAVAAGAAHLVYARGSEAEATVPAEQTGLAGLGAQITPVDDPRRALGELARAYYGSGRPGLRLLAVTGTNGKTTSAYMLEALFTGLGQKTGVLGTINYRWPGESRSAPLTTPDCLELHSLLAEMRKAGVDTAIMEVSSHALEQKRVAGLDFSGALLSNVTQDHLDYHGNMENYFQAKAGLFRSLGQEAVAVVNTDDPYGRRLCAELCAETDAPAGPGKLLAYGLKGPEHTTLPFLSGEIARLDTHGLLLRQRFQGREWELRSPLAGAFNAMNLLGVQALALGLGLDIEDLRLLESFKGAPGRMERIDNSLGLHVFVDYAHTPDALENALRALRAQGFKRVITLFGCGGNRDKGKRPLMAQAAAAWSDTVVLTSDNPRREDPLAIIQDALPGLHGMHGADRHVEPDRRAATALAVSLLRPGDALLVAGKGHEDYQIIGDKKIYYSDQAVLRELLRAGAAQ